MDANITRQRSDERERKAKDATMPPNYALNGEPPLESSPKSNGVRPLNLSTTHVPISPVTIEKSMLHAQPSSVHFNGFQLRKDDTRTKYQQRVAIHNSSTTPIRLHYTLPSTPFFQVAFPNDRKPFLSPGLCEEIIITFIPHSLENYKDSLSVKCEEIARTSRTTFLSNGRLHIPLHASPAISQIHLPKQIEFGCIPVGTTAHRNVKISSFDSVDLEYDIRVIRPHSCFTIFPLHGTVPAHGIVKIETAFSPLEETKFSVQLELNVSRAGFIPQLCVVMGSAKNELRTVENGVSKKDTGLQPQENDIKVRTQKKTELMKTDCATLSEQEISPQLTFSYLLNEEAHAIHNSTIDRLTRERLFVKQSGTVESIEKELDFQTHRIRLGEMLLTDQQLEVLHQVRATNQFVLQQQERTRRSGNVKNEAFHSSLLPSTDQLYQFPCGVLPANFIPDVDPDFKEYKNDLWRRRQRIVRRMIRAISTVITRYRAQKRLIKIKDWIGTATTRDQVKHKVEIEWKEINGNLSNTISRVDSKRLGTSTTTTLYTTGFPLLQDKNYHPRDLLPQSFEWNVPNDPFQFFSLHEPEEALRMGHTIVPLPVLPTYLPLEHKQSMRIGALDECGPQRLQSVKTGETSSVETYNVNQPSALAFLPSHLFLDRYNAAFRPLLSIPSTRETRVDYVNRPLRVFRTSPVTWKHCVAKDIGIQQRPSEELEYGCLQLSEGFAPRTERPRTCLMSRKDDDWHHLFDGVWNLHPPTLLENAEDVECLSDSESDTEQDAEKRMVELLSWRDAQLLWEDPNEEETVNGIHRFERYKQLIQLQQDYTQHRTVLMEALPTVLESVAHCLSNSSHNFIVIGHGPTRPLHHLSRDKAAS